jgi:hypothetical protein
MKSPNPLLQDNEMQNLSPEAEKVLKILDELQDFTANIRQKIMAELRPDGSVMAMKIKHD